MTFRGLKYCSILLYGLPLWVVCAQSPDFEGKRIVDIQFEPAPAPLAKQDLDRVLSLKKDAPFHADDVAATIDSLYATGRFDDIQVDAEPSGEGVVVRFITTLNFFTGHIEITGKVSKPPDRGLLISTTQLNLGTKYRDAQLTAAGTNLQKLLEANGLYEGTVQPQVTRDARTQTVNFTFHLKPGKRAKYTFPVINGNPKLSEDTILRVTGWRIPVIHWWRQVTQSQNTLRQRRDRKKYQKQDRLTARSNSIPGLRRYYAQGQAYLNPRSGAEGGNPSGRGKNLQGPPQEIRSRLQEGAVDRDLWSRERGTCGTTFKARATTMSPSISASRRPKTIN